MSDSSLPRSATSTRDRSRRCCWSCNLDQCFECRFTHAGDFLGVLVPHRTSSYTSELARSFKSRKQGAFFVNDTSGVLSGKLPPAFEIPWCMQPYASAGHHSSNGAGCYVLNLPNFPIEESAHERAVYFGLQQRELSLLPVTTDNPRGRQARTLTDLMIIRAVHSKLFRRLSLGTGLGFRTTDSVVTETPAIIVFVARKLNAQWVIDGQMLPRKLQGPGAIWCDVDVVEFSYHGAPAPARKEQVYSELVELLRGNGSHIGPGSQVANMEVYGTLGALVRSKVGKRQVGFITNRHVAVDLDYPYQKIFHPLPPNLGPGMYLGAVERASSFVTDYLWYGIYAGCSPETFVRADGAFVPFTPSIDSANLTTSIRGIGEMGELMPIDLDSPISSIVGKRVSKVGRSSGLTQGTVIAYGVEYHDEKGICFFTDLLVVGDDRKEFDLEGDSGSLIVLCAENGEKPRPIGMIWGGTSNRGRLKLREGFEPENWTSAVDLGRLVKLLQVELLPCDVALEDAWKEQLHAEEDPESAYPYAATHTDVNDSSRQPQTHASDVPSGSHHQPSRRSEGTELMIQPFEQQQPPQQPQQQQLQQQYEDDVYLHLSLSPPSKRMRHC